MKSGPKFCQFVVCCTQLRVGPIYGQVHVRDRLIELACREVISPASDPIVEVVASRQRRLQQLAAKEVLYEQRRDVALSCRGIARRPLTGRRQRPCIAQRALNVIGIEAHRHPEHLAPRRAFRIIRRSLLATVLPDVSNGFAECSAGEIFGRRAHLVEQLAPMRQTVGSIHRALRPHPRSTVHGVVFHIFGLRTPNASRQRKARPPTEAGLSGLATCSKDQPRVRERIMKLS